MSNQCLTNLTVSHHDTYKLKASSDGIENNNLFSRFIYLEDRANTKSDVYWGNSNSVQMA